MSQDHDDGAGARRRTLGPVSEDQIGTSPNPHATGSTLPLGSPAQPKLDNHEASLIVPRKTED